MVFRFGKIKRISPAATYYLFIWEFLNQKELFYSSFSFKKDKVKWICGGHVCDTRFMCVCEAATPEYRTIIKFGQDLLSRLYYYVPEKLRQAEVEKLPSCSRAVYPVSVAPAPRAILFLILFSVCGGVIINFFFLYKILLKSKKTIILFFLFFSLL